MNNAISRILEELTIFRAFSARSHIGPYEIELLGDDAFLVKPPSRHALRAERQIDLTLLGINHGNEVAGIAILNQVLMHIERNEISPKISVAFVLGNVPAYVSGKRYLTTDLNRAFGTNLSENEEQKRARMLETIFEASTFVIDFHQTQSRTDTPFYISLFDKISFLSFVDLVPSVDIVTYWDSSFSSQGMTTINYQIAKGGHGFGVEVGTKGFDDEQIVFGTKIATNFINALSRSGYLEKIDSVKYRGANVFTWSHIIKSQSGKFTLVPHLINMVKIPKFHFLGQIDGKDVFAQDDGCILFPKYPAPGECTPPGAEVCRVLRKINADELDMKIKGQYRGED